MTEQHKLHTIDVGDHGFINVERTTHEHDNIRISSNIGSSGIMQRLNVSKALELTTFLADAAGVDVVFISRADEFQTSDEHVNRCDAEQASLNHLQKVRGESVQRADMLRQIEREQQGSGDATPA